MRRRILPDGATHPLLVETLVQDGERLDNLTMRTLGDPLHYWRICDANNIMHPLELVAEAGRLVRIAQPQI